jgi:hypothetical protein
MIIYTIGNNVPYEDSKIIKHISGYDIKHADTFADALRLIQSVVVQEDVLLIKTDSVITTTNDSFVKLLDNLSKSKKDIIFLSLWGDKCHIARPLMDVTLNDNFVMYTTHHPLGTQAIFLTPNGVSKILQHSMNIDDAITGAIYNGHLDAYSIFPQPVTLDLSSITDNNEYQHLNPCVTLKVGVREINEPVDPKKNNYLGYIIIIIVLVLLLFILIKSRKK